MVSEGFTLKVPFAVTAPGLAPVLAVIVTEVAPVVLQDKVEASPSVIVAGFAVNEAITGAGTTVTVTVWVTLSPASFVAVIV